MNRNDIIRMAREAEAWSLVDHDGIAALERFAALVAAAERESVLATIEELYNMEKDRNAMFSDGYNYALDHIEKYIRGRRARELAQFNAEANGEGL